MLTHDQADLGGGLMGNKPAAFITWIKAYWLGPLVKGRPKRQSLSEFLAVIFDIEDRPIVLAKAEQSFELNGLYMKDGVHAIYGIKDFRKIKKDSTLFIRADKKSALVDIETPNACFRLTEGEYEKIRRYLTLPSN